MKKLIATVVRHNGNSLSITKLNDMIVSENSEELYVFDEYPKFAFSFLGKKPKNINDDFFGDAFVLINHKYYWLSNVNNSNLKSRCDFNNIVKLIEARHQKDEPLLLIKAYNTKETLLEDDYVNFSNTYKNWRFLNFKN